MLSCFDQICIAVESVVSCKKSGSVLFSPSTGMKGETNTDQIFLGSGLEESLHE